MAVTLRALGKGDQVRFTCSSAHWVQQMLGEYLVWHLLAVSGSHSRCPALTRPVSFSVSHSLCLALTYCVSPHTAWLCLALIVSLGSTGEYWDRVELDEFDLPVQFDLRVVEWRRVTDVGPEQGPALLKQVQYTHFLGVQQQGYDAGGNLSGCCGCCCDELTY